MKRPGIPDDIYRALRRWCCVRRAAHVTRDHVRRVRVMISDASGRCATPAALNRVPAQPVGSILAAPPRGQSRLAPVTGEQNFTYKKPAEAGSCASPLTANQR